MSDTMLAILGTLGGTIVGGIVAHLSAKYLYEQQKRDQKEERKNEFIRKLVIWRSNATLSLYIAPQRVKSSDLSRLANQGISLKDILESNIDYIQYKEQSMYLVSYYMNICRLLRENETMAYQEPFIKYFDETAECVRTFYTKLDEFMKEII